FLPGEHHPWSLRVSGLLWVGGCFFVLGRRICSSAVEGPSRRCRCVQVQADPWKGFAGLCGVQYGELLLVVAVDWLVEDSQLNDPERRSPHPSRVHRGGGKASQQQD
ncbi:unnamed protein product, partial [Hapterophycus canaliculatus]